MAICYPCPYCGHRWIYLKNPKCPACGRDTSKASSKKYHVILWVEDKNGKRRQVRRKVPGDNPTLTHARLYEAKLKEESLSGSGIKVGEPDPKVSKLWNDYINWCRLHNKPSWVKRKEGVWKHWLAPYFADRRLKSVTTRTIEQYLLWRKEQDPEVTQRTLQLELAIIKNMFQKAVEWDLIKENPAKKVQVKTKGTPYEAWHILTQEEAKRLVDACLPPLSYIVKFALLTGWRKQEILKLQWDQVDLEKGVAILPSTKSGQTQVRVLSSEALALLKEVLTRYGRREYVFANPATGKPYTNVNKGFKSALKRAKLPLTIRFHDLRHTYASWAIQRGVPIAVLKELLGHSTLQMVMRYTHITPEHLRQQADKVTLDRPHLRVVGDES